MTSIFLIVKSSFKQRKTQSLINGISLVLVSLLLSSSLGILQVMQEPFDQSFNQLKASHLLLNFDVRSICPDSLSNWFASQSEVSRIGQPAPFFMSTDPILFKGQKIDLMIQITEYGADHLYQDQVAIIKGKSASHPGVNEIWLPEYLAKRHRIQTGDTIGIPFNGSEYRLKVSAL